MIKCESLDDVRHNIDRIDNEIIKLIAERGAYVKQAAAFKKNEKGVRDKGRVEKVIAGAREKAVNHGADPDVVETVYRSMIAAFINIEMKEFKK
jgi:isochorismate pyruvate lyase